MGPCGTRRTYTSKSCLAVDREFMYIGSAGPGWAGGRAGGRADGRTAGHGRADWRADGRAVGTILNDSTTIFIDFHKKHKKTSCFPVVSRPAEAQVPIFTAGVGSPSPGNTE